MENSDRPQNQNPTALLGRTTVEERSVFLTSRLPLNLDPITPTLPPRLTPPFHPLRLVSAGESEEAPAGRGLYWRMG